MNTVTKIITNGFFSDDNFDITRLSTAAKFKQNRYYKIHMKMNRFIHLILCILLFPVSLFAQDVFKPFATNRFDLYFSTAYFASLANYDAGGSKQNLISGAAFQDTSLSSEVRYLFHEKMGVRTGVHFNNVVSNNGTQTRTNSAVTHYSVGADLQVYNTRYWSIYLDGAYKISAQEINSSTDDALASDGVNEGLVSAVIAYDDEAWRFYGKAGYNHRLEGLSGLATYGLGGDFGNSIFKVGLNFFGISTIQDDEKTATPFDRDLLTTRVNAGSRRYYSINPNLLEGQLYVVYNWDKDLAVKVFSGQTLMGSNAADGFTFGLAFNWGFGPTKKGIRSNSTPNKSKLSDDEAGFKVETEDGVNQDLFQPTQTPNQAPKQK